MSRTSSRGYGGTILARGGRYQIMEGPEDFHRFIVIEFPTLEQGVACFNSPEYQEAAAFRRGGAGVVENVIVEGVGRMNILLWVLQALLGGGLSGAWPALSLSVAGNAGS